MDIENNVELKDAIERVREYGTDLASLELKSAANGFPKSTASTISAFANTNGGIIVFGVPENANKPVEDIDLSSIQNGCAQAAREQVEPPVAPKIEIMRFDNKPVVVATIPELDARQKPCFIKKLGKIQGSYLRTGDGDHQMTLYEIDRFIENQHRSARNDATIVPDAALDDFDKNLLTGWLTRVRASSFGRMDGMEDVTVMANRRVVAPDGDTLRPTIAGLLAMGSYPQKFFPRLNVAFTSYQSSRKGDSTKQSTRYADAVNIDGSIPEMIVNTVFAVSRNMNHGAIVKGALREDVPDYPLPAIREAVANALMHRDFSAEAQGEPVLVELYPDRLEISNPGGLYGSLTVEALGTRGGTISRNQFLSRILEDVPFTDYDGSTGHVVENRGTGYPTITNELERALMGKPIVQSSLDGFRIMFRHRRMTEQESSSYSKRNVETAILEYFAQHESASTSEIAKASGISTKTINRYISRLIEEGILEGIGSQYSPKRRYRLYRS